LALTEDLYVHEGKLRTCTESFHRTIIIYITKSSVSRRLILLCIKFEIRTQNCLPGLLWWGLCCSIFG
jgi:hypothetical protein